MGMGHNANEKEFGQGKYGAASGKLYDALGMITFDAGTVPPSDGATGYAQGAIFVQTDAGGSASAILSNTGTSSSSAFTSIIGAVGGIGISVPLLAAQFNQNGSTNYEASLWTAPINCTISGIIYLNASAAANAGTAARIKLTSSGATVQASSTVLDGGSSVNLTTLSNTNVTRNPAPTNITAGQRIGIDTAQNAAAISGLVGTMGFLIYPR